MLCFCHAKTIALLCKRSTSLTFWPLSGCVALDQFFTGNFNCEHFQHTEMSITGASSAPPPKRKEIYKYEAPWTVFSMNWSIRPDKRFRLALGSFVEEYNNKVYNLGYCSVS